MNHVQKVAFWALLLCSLASRGYCRLPRGRMHGRLYQRPHRIVLKGSGSTNSATSTAQQTRNIPDLSSAQAQVKASSSQQTKAAGISSNSSPRSLLKKYLAQQSDSSGKPASKTAAIQAKEKNRGGANDNGDKLDKKVPMLSRLIQAAGDTGKQAVAMALGGAAAGAIASVIGGDSQINLHLPVDSVVIENVSTNATVATEGPRAIVQSRIFQPPTVSHTLSESSPTPAGLHPNAVDGSSTYIHVAIYAGIGCAGGTVIALSVTVVCHIFNKKGEKPASDVEEENPN